MKRVALALTLLLAASRLDAATLTVCASACTYTNAQLQTAINAATSGDTITLEAGVTYTGNFTLPSKGNASVITIKSNASAGSLPGVGVRTSPAFAAFLPKIQASAGGAAAFQFLANAQNYTLENLEFLGNPGGFNAIIAIGFRDGTQYLRSQEPHDIVLDRIYFHADPVTGQKIGIAIDGTTLTVKNSFGLNCHGVGQDTQALSGINGSGPITISNNHLEGGTEIIMFGGGDPAIRTYLTVTGSATTTGAAVQIVEANHTLAELASGQLVAIEVTAGNVQFATLTAQPGSGTTGTLAWTPAVTAAPAVGLRIRGGLVPKTISITGNHLIKPTAWQTGPLTPPTGLTATPSTASGTLAAVTNIYLVQMYSTAGYQNNTVWSDASAEVSATLSATGKIDLAWTDITGETAVRVWSCASSGATSCNYTDLAANTTTLSDNGSVNWLPATLARTGTRFQIKNLIEFKAAQGVTMTGNVLEQAWKGSDTGWTGIWAKSVNQDGGCWWCQSRDIDAHYNIWRHLDGWLNVSAREPFGPNPLPPPLTNTSIHDNLIYDSNSTWSDGAGAPYAMKVRDGSVDLHVEHNTIVHQGAGLLQIGGLVHSGFIYRNNLSRREFFGLLGDGTTTEGKPTLDALAPGYVFTNNTLASANCAIYPAGNFCPTNTAWESEFVAYSADGTNADYHLKPTSLYHNAATDGIDLGANIDAVLAATAGVVQGTSTNPPQITLLALPNAIRTVAYPSTTLTATGGTLPYTWSVNAGSTLPTGLAFSSAGVLTGTPTASAGSYSFTLKVVDNAALSGTQAYTITIANATSITTTTLSSAETNLRYAVTLAASGDAAPYTWLVTTGALPLGMTLTSAGLLSGTPTVAGTANFTVRATGSLGSTTTQALSLLVGSETRPCDRNIAQNRSSGFLFRQKTAPVDGPPECPMRGDVWVDTSTASLSVNLATAVNPVVWTPLTTQAVLTGDGSLVTHVNASAVDTGTLPASVLPSAISAGASVTTPLVASDYLALNQTACATLAGSGTIRICADTASGQLKVSVNGGPYAAIASGGSSFTPTGGGNIYLDPGPTSGYMKLALEVDRTADLYSQGFTTAKPRKAYLTSLQGGFQQALGFADSNVSTDYVFALSVSQDTGGTWTRAFGVRQDGMFTVKAFTLETGSKPSCLSGIRGQFWYVAGGAAVIDTVEVCAKDGADAYAWRVIY